MRDSSRGETLGHVRALTRYPVKSMAGVALESAFLGWHGLAGDRRFAFRRPGVPGGMPLLSASRLPELLRYQPLAFDESSGEPLPARVRAPSGEEFDLRSEALAREISERLGSAVELLQFRNGLFDDGAVSVISRATIAGIGREAGRELDPRRFRANILLEPLGDEASPFAEDGWLGGRLLFGDGDDGPVLAVTLRDERCVMLDFDPDTAARDERVMKTVVRLNKNLAGVYGTVVRTGTLRVGQAVWWASDRTAPE